MFYCGLDIAGVSSFVFLTDARGKKVACGPVATTRAALQARFKPYVRAGLAIAIEAGNQGNPRHRRLLGSVPELHDAFTEALPLIEPVCVSVAVSVCVPLLLKVTRNVCTPASAATNV